jgi:hypothetical protein
MAADSNIPLIFKAPIVSSLERPLSVLRTQFSISTQHSQEISMAGFYPNPTNHKQHEIQASIIFDIFFV